MTDIQIIEQFLETIKTVRPSFDFERVKKACSMAKKAHKNQKRKSGEPFIIHPIQVATKMANKFDDEDLVIASIIHDAIEDDENTHMEDAYEQFGDDVGWMVDSVTKIFKFYHKKPDLIFKDKIEKLLYGGLKDVRCLILKNCDRENNLSTLGNLPDHKQIRMTFETQAIYKPLQSILKCNDMKSPVKTRKDRLNIFVKENNITDISSFKHTLYNYAFQNLNDELFELIYANTASIVWKIEDKEMYRKLVESEDFENKVEVISLEQDLKGNFLCTFRYKQGKVFDSMNNLEISSFIH